MPIFETKEAKIKLPNYNKSTVERVSFFSNEEFLSHCITKHSSAVYSKEQQFVNCRET